MRLYGFPSFARGINGQDKVQKMRWTSMATGFSIYVRSNSRSVMAEARMSTQGADRGEAWG